MNREEILARSQQENKGKLDERDQAIQTKANSISQGMGFVLCPVMGLLGFSLSGRLDSLFCAMTILWGMFAVERIVCAARAKNSVGQWVLAGIITAVFIAALVAYVLVLLDVL